MIPSCMSKKDKLIALFSERPTRKDVTWNDLESLLSKLDFEKIKDKGGRVAFMKKDKPETLIAIHRPHPENTLKRYVIELVWDKIKGER